MVNSSREFGKKLKYSTSFLKPHVYPFERGVDKYQIYVIIILYIAKQTIHC